MGERQADKIEALQARVRELEGRVRVLTEERDDALARLRGYTPFTGGPASVVALAPDAPPPVLGSPVYVDGRLAGTAAPALGASVWLPVEGVTVAPLGADARAPILAFSVPDAAVPPVLVAGEVLDEPRCGKPDPEGRACTLAADHARPDDHDGKPGPYTGAAALVMGGPLPPLLADEDDA